MKQQQDMAAQKFTEQKTFNPTINLESYFFSFTGFKEDFFWGHLDLVFVVIAELANISHQVSLKSSQQIQRSLKWV